MNLINFLLFQMSPQPEGGKKDYSMWIMILVVIVIFYFFMIRPQAKKQKKVQNYRESLKRGDKIITIGGIHAKITDVQEDSFIIEVEDGTKMKIEKAAVAIDPVQLREKGETK